jgi:hypothetical protein
MAALAFRQILQMDAGELLMCFTMLFNSATFRITSIDKIHALTKIQ